MREEDSYVDIGNRFLRAIQGLHPEWEVAYSENKFLPQMISEIEGTLNGKTDYHDSYIPNLKLDILMGVKKDSSPHISLVLLEVKVNVLTLNHQAHLLGYLMAAPLIKCGILFCVLPPTRSAQNAYMSSDFQELLNLMALPMGFTTTTKTMQSSFRLGISYYQYQSMIKWRDSQDRDAICSFAQLVDYIESI